MSVREVLERLNKMDRNEFREKMREAVLGDFFRKMMRRRKPCKLISQKQ